MNANTSVPPSPEAGQDIFGTALPPPEGFNLNGAAKYEDAWKLKHLPLRMDVRPDDYPIDYLPPLIMNAVEEVAADTQAPVALIAASALSIVSTAVQSYVSVERDQNLRGPAALFLLTVASSGERKTSCDNRFSYPVGRWEDDQRQELKPAQAEFAAQLKAWDAGDKGIQDALRKVARDNGNMDELNKRAVEHELRKPREPRSPSVLRGDDTPEALAKHLSAWPVASIISSEAGVIFGSHGMNPDSVMRNLAQMNTFWDGGRLKRGRTTADNIDIQDMRVTAGLMVQPETLDAFIAKTGGLARGIGYFARFMLSRPESTMGTRYYREPKPGNPALAAFHKRVEQILRRKANVDEDGRLMTTYLPLDAEAKAIWIAFHDEMEEALGAGMQLHDVKDVASKAAENAARLACCFQYFTQDESGTIGRDHMKNGTVLVRWYMDEALRFARQTAVPQGILNAEALEKFLVKWCRKKEVINVDARVVSTSGPEAVRPRKERDEALDLLSAHYRVHLLKFGSKNRGERVEILVNPAVMREYPLA